MPLTDLQLEQVRSLLVTDPTLGRPAIAKALNLPEHLVRAALQQLGHRARAGRKGPPPPTPLPVAEWRPYTSDRRYLLALGEALARRAEVGAGLTLEEVEELAREIRARG